RLIETLDLLARARTLGERVARRTESWIGRIPSVKQTRGMGLMRAVVLGEPADEGGRGDPLVKRLLRRGILALTEGPSGDVLAITPPLVIEEAQLDHALDVIEEELSS
ncbi:MAG TPA: aminotransferase class III-fold pyridoxal phosphate-dependent enzyme, partial [Longimicrobiales bacterium]